MRCSLVITTYNWEAALDLCLLSARRQSRLPDEVIVADDGSRPDTGALLRRHANDYPVPLRHCWQPDRGFRAARARNFAIAAAQGDYVLLVDGDMVLHRNFVDDHLWAARPGSFVQGMRVLTTPEAGERLLATRETRVTWSTPGLARRRHTLRSRALARLSLALTEGQRRAGIKTCNQGWWRDDLLRLNGFDERFVGWGREDDDLAARAFHAGLTRRSLRFAGLATHLYHHERHEDGASRNDALLAEHLAHQTIRCDQGVDGHLALCAAEPASDLRQPGGRPLVGDRAAGGA